MQVWDCIWASHCKLVFARHARPQSFSALTLMPCATLLSILHSLTHAGAFPNAELIDFTLVGASDVAIVDLGGTAACNRSGGSGWVSGVVSGTWLGTMDVWRLRPAAPKTPMPHSNAATTTIMSSPLSQQSQQLQQVNGNGRGRGSDSTDYTDALSWLFGKAPGSLLSPSESHQKRQRTTLRVAIRADARGTLGFTPYAQSIAQGRPAWRANFTFAPEGGLPVSAVEASGNAAKAGLRVWDVITHVNGTDVSKLAANQVRACACF